MHAFVEGVSLFGPGLNGWAASRAVLRGEADWTDAPLAVPPPALLSATERRRTGAVVRLALAVAQAASEMAGAAPGALRSVFACANGDGTVVTTILDALVGGDGMVSPTQFHNSVHNAAAGYWSIATASRQPATCLGCHDATFAAGLLKAIAEMCVEGERVLLCAYDAPLPDPLAAHRPTLCAFGIGLVLAPSPGERTLGRIDVAHVAAEVEPGRVAPRSAALARLACGNPAARGLRLLEALARGEAEGSSLPYLDGRLDVLMRP